MYIFPLKIIVDIAHMVPYYDTCILFVVVVLKSIEKFRKSDLEYEIIFSGKLHQHPKNYFLMRHQF